MKNEFIARFLAIEFHVGGDDAPSIHLAWPNSIILFFWHNHPLILQVYSYIYVSHKNMNAYQYNWLQNISQIMISDNNLIVFMISLENYLRRYSFVQATVLYQSLLAIHQCWYIWAGTKSHGSEYSYSLFWIHILYCNHTACMWDAS